MSGESLYKCSSSDTVGLQSSVCQHRNSAEEMFQEIFYMYFPPDKTSFFRSLDLDWTFGRKITVKFW